MLRKKWQLASLVLELVQIRRTKASGQPQRARGWNRNRPNKAGPAQMHKALDMKIFRIWPRPHANVIRAMYSCNGLATSGLKKTWAAYHKNHCWGDQDPKHITFPVLQGTAWSYELLGSSLLRITERSVEPSARSKV